jgi:sugar lactone lactonase YvrE
MNHKNLIRFATWSAGLVCAVALFPTAIEAQAVTFSGLRTTAINNFSGSVTGISLDQIGDKFITTMDPAEVIKIGVTGSQTVLYSDPAADTAAGLSTAADHAGNLYIADSGINQVVKITPGGTRSVVANGLNWPDSVAVDGSGNVYIADQKNNRVVEAPAGGGSLLTILNLQRPLAVAADNAGDVYIGNVEQIVELPAGGAQAVVTTDVLQVSGMAADAQGNLYVADNGGLRILKEQALGGGQFAEFTIDQPNQNLSGIGVDATGNVFYPLFINSTSTVSSLIELGMNAVSLGSANLCPNGPTPAPCEQILPLTFQANQSNANLSVQLFTGGRSGGEFSQGTMTCLTSTPPEAPNTQCQVNVRFNPAFPGLRQGAIEVTNASGAVLATTYLYGVGNGPQLGVLPPTPNTLYTGNGNPMDGVAVDLSGNVYVANADSANVIKIAPGGAHTTFGSNWTSPRGIAVDGAGNVYVADDNSLYKLNPAGQQLWKASGFSIASGVAVTAQGNVWVADLGAPTASEFTSAGSLIFKAPLPSIAAGVAVDANGNAYFTDPTENQIAVLSPTGTLLKTIEVPGYSVEYDAVDAAGNVYFAGYSGLFEIPANGPLAGTPLAISAPLPLQGVAIDPFGDLFVTTVNSNVAEFPALASNLIFPAILPGTTETESYIAQNFGNATLTNSYLDLNGSKAFTQVSGSGQLTECVSGFALTPGAACNLSFAFTPQSPASVVGWLQLASNTDNASNVVQLFNLLGRGLPRLNQTITGFNLSSAYATVGGTVNLSASATSGLPITFISQTPSVCSVYNGQGYVDALLNAAGTCTIAATQQGNVEYNAAPTIVQSFTVYAN